MIVAIDGPAGSGKSTIARLVSKRLGFLHIDTGAMYRALTLKALETGTSIDDTRAIAALANDSTIDLVEKNDTLQVYLDGTDVSTQIRQPRITQHVSDVAKIKEVRQVMVSLQRSLGRQKDSVLEGRDIGTVVFPDAEWKFFLDAHFDERVRRRYKDMQKLNVASATMESVAADLKNRDTIDSSRAVAPLKQAADAIYLDTTRLTIDEVVNQIVTRITAPHDR